jgi:putative Mn2+ efflux pump MntP
VLELGVLAVAVGSDNLRAGLALGWAGTSARRRMWFAFVFGLVECGMPLLGLALGSAAFASADVTEAVAPAAITVCGVLVLADAARDRRGSRERARSFGDRPWVLVVLPVALGVDNLAAGVALAALEVPIVLALTVIGLVSSTLAAAGLWLGDVIRLWAPSRVLAGFALLAIAAVARS